MKRNVEHGTKEETLSLLCLEPSNVQDVPEDPTRTLDFTPISVHMRDKLGEMEEEEDNVIIVFDGQLD